MSHAAISIVAVLVTGLVHGLVPGGLAIGNENTQQADKESANDRRREIAQSAVIDVVGNRESDPDPQLFKDPIYKYHEVERGFHHATTWLWGTKNGRPTVVLNLSGSDRLFYEFMSLSNDQVRFDVSGVSWTPKAAWNPEPVPTDSRPSGNRRLRLGQMRALARKFSAYQVDYEKENKRHYLRLLAEPMHRYENESRESLDGALFGFVRNGDLEIILTIEAQKRPDGKSRWVFDCDRVATFEQHVEFDKKEVWSCSRRDFGGADDDYYVKIVDLSEQTPNE